MGKSGIFANHNWVGTGSIYDQQFQKPGQVRTGSMFGWFLIGFGLVGSGYDFSEEPKPGSYLWVG